MTDLTLIVLAAGKGTRMRNDRYKVLHPLAGRSLIGHVVALADHVAAARVIVVLSPGMQAVEAEVRRWRSDASISIQEQALGTGDAVRSALPQIPPTGTLLVLYGDTPLLSVDSIEKLAAKHPGVKVVKLDVHCKLLFPFFQFFFPF